ncbi:hypothetical protein HZU77_015000, partial [Neisseriaceae bacterium TC5R-5]|nr:hypothetical protein [Neisseriaceae bacterium TC5R-5]
MALVDPKFLKYFFNQITAIGEKAISGDFALEIEGIEQSYLLCKQAPWPELSATGEIEIATFLGTKMWQTQQVKINQQGPIAFYETPRGHGDDILKQLIMGGGYFNAI